MRKSWPYFGERELRCKCHFADCPKHGMDEAFMNRLVSLRRVYDRPIILNSAYRCPRYNNVVSDTGVNGPHTTGRAVDIRIYGHYAWELMQIAFDMQFTGVGIHQKGDYPGRFVHLDDLDSELRPRVWSY